MPCAALGGGLARAGHTVRLATFENFAGLAQRYQLDFTRVSGDAQAMVQAAGPNLARILFQFFNLARQYSRDFSAPELRETDLILNQLPGGLFGWDLAEKAGVPMLALAYLPIQATNAYPMISYPRLFSRLPGYNRLTYRIAEQSVWQFFRGPVNRWRREILGLPAQKPGGRFSELGTPACPWIVGASPQLIPHQADWPPEVYLTGYWYPQEEDWQPPAELARFLDSGSAPVFIGFGSMPVGDSLRVTQMIISAVDQAGLRAVLHAGWSGLGDLRLPENILRIDYAPYEWLFPRMAGLVIHGGVGSVHFAARSGVPALVVPFVFDQFVWGRRFAAIGSGPPPLPFRRLTPERLACALQSLVNDAPMRAAAARLGNAVWQEAGIPAAVELIETICDRTPAPGRGQPLKYADAAGGLS